MRKLIILIVIVLIALGSYLFLSREESVSNNSVSTENSETFVPDPSGATFIFDGETITLSNGRHESTLTGTAMVEEIVLLKISDNGDINNDGKEDVVSYFSQSGGGSGVFIYIAAYVSGPVNYKGTDAIFIGDRVSPQSISIANGIITASYLDRGEDEPFAAEPTIQVTKKFVYTNGTLREQQ